MHDGRSAADMFASIRAGQTLLADRAHDSDALHEALAARGAFANIRLMPNRVRSFPFDANLHKARNAVERFFNNPSGRFASANRLTGSDIKHFRAVATRHDKRDDNYLASVQLASFRIWSRSYESVT